MPVKIPTYDARLTPSGQISARATGVENSAATGQALQNIGSAVGQGEDLYRQKQNADAIANTGKQLSESDGFWTNRLQQMSQSAVDGGMVKDADGNVVPMTHALQSEFGKWRDDFLAGIDNPKAKIYAQQHLDSLWSQTYRSSLLTEAKLGVENRSDKINQSVLDWANQAAADPTLAQRNRSSALTMIANSGLDEHSRATMAMAAQKAITESAMYGAIQRDPAGAQASLTHVFGGGFDSAVEFTLKHEGGYSAADNNGAPVNFGINQKWHPDVNVKDLTRDQAKQIYRDQYWNAIGGDELAAQNPALASAAFDTAVLAGAPRTKQMLAQAGGDVGKFMDLREQYQAQLSKKNPAKYGGDVAAGWAKRNADLRASVAGGDPTVTELARGLDPSRAYQFLNAATTEVNRQQAVLRSQLTVTESNQTAAAMNGDPVAQPLTQADYVKAYGDVEGTARYSQFAANQQLGADIGAMKLLPPDQLQAKVEAYKPDSSKPGYELGLQRFQIAAKAADQVLAARAADPMAYAIQNKVGDAAPLPFSDMEQLGPALAQRAGVAASMQQTYAVPYALLTKGEAQTLSQGFQRMTTQQKMGYLNAIRTSLSDPAAYKSVLQQIAPDSPVTAVAGNILGKQQGPVSASHWFAPNEHFDPQAVAGLILEGEALINPTKAAQGENGRGKMFPMPKEQDLRAQFKKNVKDAFASAPTAADYAFQAVKAYYAGKAAQMGDVSGETNDQVLTEAITATLGGVTDPNGQGHVLRPWGMPEDTFKDALQAAFNKSGAPGNLRNYRVQNGGGDRYLLSSGTGFLKDAAGNPVVLDLTQAPVNRNLPAPAPAVITPDKRQQPNMQRPKTK